MDDLLGKLEEKHKSFTEDVGLNLVAREYSPEFGGSACLKYSDGAVSLMVTKSRDGVGYYCTDDDWRNDNWYSMDIIWNYLRQNAEYQNMKAANHFSFFQENFTRISEIFQPSEKGRTARGLHILEKSRSKKLFG